VDGLTPGHKFPDQPFQTLQLLVSKATVTLGLTLVSKDSCGISYTGDAGEMDVIESKCSWRL
jgi:hypothetical protein